uniref:xaa-Pro aminopeptidase 3 isoform X2 n=1 Tax=Agelaius phoeniceus TaxID=39638 RepID=UPI0023ED3A35|nr:xaa-Pro aminopeptidase 3 isoform X2 [Agelaius phoeniceus]
MAWQLHSAPCRAAPLLPLPRAPPRGHGRRPRALPSRRGAAHWRRAARRDGVSARRREAPPCAVRPGHVAPPAAGPCPGGPGLARRRSLQVMCSPKIFHPACPAEEDSKPVFGAAQPLHTPTSAQTRRDPNRELWDGPRSGPDGAIALTGVDEAYTIEEFRHLVAKLKGESNVVWYDLRKPVHAELHSDYMQPLADIKARSKNRIQAVRHLVQNLRLIKSPAEIERMKIAGRVTAEAFTETMFASKTPVDEAFLYAKFEFECRTRGADILAYPPVVAGGNRSNTLHYVKNNQLIKDGELVLLDGGCEFSCYVSDITRTWPVNGRFTKPQAELYQAVLDIQKSCLSLCSPGMSLENIYSLMLSLIGQKLKDLGVLQSSITDSHFFKAVRKYCPHHVGHYLGMDVHDTPDISRSIPFQPGMVITIEPGIYIPEDDVSAPERFRGIGVRIEDDVVITEDAPLVLSADCPKDIYHLEQICGRSS